MKNSNFIRDLLVKVLLVVIFVFLLMYLFPTPNLTPFYSSIFNDNIQTMKDAAEDYYTTERMPSKVGDSSKMSLQEMIDQKLIIPFVDKDGNSCDTKKSYVEVTKKDSEYELKVSLTCGKESNYIIEKIGCYNFCPTGNCTLTQMKEAEESSKVDVVTKTDKDGNVSVVIPTGGRYVYEYEYTKKLTTESWKTGDWTTKKEKENSNVVLVDKRTQYTGQKKVTSGTILYEQIAYGYKDNWTYDKDWTTKTTCDGKCTLWKERTLYTGQKKITTTTNQYKHIKYGQKDNWTYDTNWTTNTSCTPKVSSTTDGIINLTPTCQLWKERTLYTGQKKISSGTTQYKHIKYGYKDNWTYDSDWTTTVKTETNNLKLWKERTLYTGQKKTTTTTTEYQHVKYGTKYEWNETGWTDVKTKETDDIKLIDTRYTVRKTIQTPTTTCEGSTLDTTWYTSKPADTSTRVYNSTPTNTKTNYNWKVVKDSFKSYSALSTYEGNYWYEFLYTDEETCTIACNGNAKVTVYYYRVYEKNGSYNTYQYSYCTPKSTTTSSVDEKVVSDPTTYVNNGYKIVKTEYNYKVRKTIKYIVDTKWTTSKNSPTGYEYTGNTSTTVKVSYESLGKWVTNKENLGEYTYNIVTAKQYKYAYNNPEKYVIDTKWTTSITPPAGYEYTGKTATTTTVTYEPLGKWVTSYEALGDYTVAVQTVKQYKYAYNNPVKYVVDIQITSSITPPSGYVYTGEKSTSTKVTYESLGKWVTNISALGDYVYNIKTVKQYKYAYNNPTKYIKDTIWTTENVARSGYELTGNTKTTTKTTYIDLGKWVNSKSALGEYTYNIKTRTQYKYKYRTVKTTIDTIWARSNPGNGYEPTGNYRKQYIQDYTNKQK